MGTSFFADVGDERIQIGSVSRVITECCRRRLLGSTGIILPDKEQGSCRHHGIAIDPDG